MPDATKNKQRDLRQDDQAIRSLTFQLIVLMNLITKPFNAVHGARHGIALSEWRCIMWLAACPDASGQDTADGIGMDRMSVSRNLRSLERKGLAKRSEDQKDRKRWNWRLSSKGWSVYLQILPAAMKRDQLIESNLSPASRDAVAEFLASAKAMLESEDEN
ncbi:MAG: MarR family winged helix-turn-helix transcriptional regulator [Pseudomonadota bacterium]